MIYIMVMNRRCYELSRNKLTWLWVVVVTNRRGYKLSFLYCYELSWLWIVIAPLKLCSRYHLVLKLFPTSVDCRFFSSDYKNFAPSMPNNAGGQNCLMSDRTSGFNIAWSNSKCNDIFGDNGVKNIFCQTIACKCSGPDYQNKIIRKNLFG